ncbi:MAG: inositol monophosphatase family protein [Actinomycetota bacterium]
MSTDYSAELGRALDLARTGGEIAMRYFGRAPQRTRKEDGTWVTEADEAVEAHIRAGLSAAFPQHNILGEEEGLLAAGGGDPHPGAPTWVVDPIDGTHNYMEGIPVWAVLIALRVDDASVLGVAHAPALRETYDGAVGAGARFNGASIEVSKAGWEGATTGFANWTGLIDLGLKRGFDAIAGKSWRVRGFGDFWGHMLVARGAAHVMLEPELSLWDVAALEPIVREAGGRITGLDGAPWKNGGCLTTNGVLHEEALQILREQGA